MEVARVDLLLVDVKADLLPAVVKADLLPVVAMVRRAVNVRADRSRPISYRISITQAGGSSLLPARCVERSTVRQIASDSHQRCTPWASRKVSSRNL